MCKEFVEEFYSVLRKHGADDYWCDPTFNLYSNPEGSIVVSYINKEDEKSLLNDLSFLIKRYNYHIICNVVDYSDIDNIISLRMSKEHRFIVYAKNKGKKFLRILKNHGVSEYWCEEAFDINKDYATEKLIIAKKHCKNPEKLAFEIFSLYYDWKHELNESVWYPEVIDNTEEFKEIIQQYSLVRRVVNLDH